MKNQSLKIALLSALGISCLVGIGSLMKQDIHFFANEAVEENGVYSLTLTNTSTVDGGTVKTNLGNSIHLSSTDGTTYNADGAFATIPTGGKLYSASTGFQVIKSLQVFYEGSKLGYQLSLTSGDDSAIVEFDSGTKVYMLNQYQHFTLKNIGSESSNVTKIVVEYGCAGSLDNNMYNYTTGDSSYWTITTDENGVTTITSNYEYGSDDHALLAFMTLKGVRMGVGSVAYDIDFSPESATAVGNLKGFATNVYSESTVYGADYISSGLLSAADATTTDGRVMTYGFKPTGADAAVGWAHTPNPVADKNGVIAKNNGVTRIVTQVEDSISKGKVISNFIDDGTSLVYKSVTGADLSAFTGKCVGLQLHHKGISVSNVVITSLDDAVKNSAYDIATASTVAEAPTTGTGTAEDPYLIESVSHLLWFKEEVSTAPSACVKLMKNLDLANMTFTALCSSSSKPYTGTFDGNGYDIKGIINTNSTSPYISFFGYASNATIKNLTLDVKYLSSADTVSGFVARADNALSITNCTLKGFVYGVGINSGVGGFISYVNSGSPTISNCVNYATIKNGAASGNTFAGGFVASNSAAATNFTITNCVNYGHIFALGSFVGGIIGLFRVGSGNVIESCINFGNISGIVAPNAQVSGIAGNNRNTINSCLVYENCLINGKLASLYDLGTSTVQGYLVGKLDASTGVLGSGNGLCDINGNPIA